MSVKVPAWSVPFFSFPHSSWPSRLRCCRLVLLLSNHIGDLAVLKQAYQLARGQDAAASQQPDAGKRAITPVAPTHAA